MQIGPDSRVKASAEAPSLPSSIGLRNSAVTCIDSCSIIKQKRTTGIHSKAKDFSMNGQLRVVEISENLNDR